MKNINIVFQESKYDCVIASLAMASNFLHKERNTLDYYKNFFPKNREGYSISEFEIAAKDLNIKVDSFRTNVYELTQLNDLCVVLLNENNFNHYVILKSINSKGAIILDPIKGEQKLYIHQFFKLYTGICLTVKKTKKIKRKNHILSSLIIKEKILPKLILINLVISFLSILNVLINRKVLDTIISQQTMALQIFIIAILNVTFLSCLGFISSYFNYKILYKYEEKIYSDNESESFIKTQEKILSSVKNIVLFLSNILNSLSIIFSFIFLFRNNTYFLRIILFYSLISVIFHWVMYLSKKNDSAIFMEKFNKLISAKESGKKTNSFLKEKQKIERKIYLRGGYLSLISVILKKILLYFIFSISIYFFSNNMINYEEIYYIYFVFPFILSKVDMVSNSTVNYLILKPILNEANYYYSKNF